MRDRRKSYDDVADELREKIRSGEIKKSPPTHVSNGQKYNAAPSHTTDHSEWSPHWVKDQLSLNKYLKETGQKPREFIPLPSKHADDCNPLDVPQVVIEQVE